MNRRLFFHALLALLLLLAQQGAALHAFSHLTEIVSTHSGQDKKSPHSSPACDKCIAYAEVGGGMHSVPLVFHGVDTHFVQSPLVCSEPSSRMLRAYSSRGPPSLA